MRIVKIIDIRTNPEQEVSSGSVITNPCETDLESAINNKTQTSRTFEKMLFIQQ